MIWLSILLMILGAAIAAVAFVFNADTPLQLGPAPVVLGAVMFLGGLLWFVRII